MASEKYGHSLGGNHGYISPNDGKHPPESSLSIPIRNVMADYKRQYSTLCQLKHSDMNKILCDFDVNWGYISPYHGNIHPNHNPLSKSLMLWSNTNTNFRYYHISLIMHMWKQINNILWKSRSYFSWSRETPIRIIWDCTEASFRIPCPKK